MQRHYAHHRLNGEKHNATTFLSARRDDARRAQAPAATTLVASCVVITAIVVPVITALWAKHGASRVRAT
ncbi:2-keto-3-deoxygluconate permease [Escherichia coli]|uniref:2-keto-3-deoxygluconate permease n=1 Tax=Escherichia coli TaxID=562 RepID=UPI0020363150|nr:2-keto-3-deoxygluconate permease [Escherichia coli]